MANPRGGKRPGSAWNDGKAQRWEQGRMASSTAQKKAQWMDEQTAQRKEQERKVVLSPRHSWKPEISPWKGWEDNPPPWKPPWHPGREDIPPPREEQPDPQERAKKRREEDWEKDWSTWVKQEPKEKKPNTRGLRRTQDWATPPPPTEQINEDCIHQSSSTGCRWGRYCNRIHSSSQWIICHHYMKLSCKFGRDCPLAHRGQAANP